MGLDGTGDSKRSIFAIQSATNMMKKFGLAVSSQRISLKNIAAVMVTAEVDPFLPAGSQIDVLVSSIGDAKSLEGGTLVMTPLSDARGQQLAQAQGPVSIGGFNIESSGGDRIRKNYVHVGRVPDGATLVRASSVSALPDSALFYNLKQPDFTTAFRMAQVINAKAGNDVAVAINAVQIKINIPSNYASREMEFISIIENLEVEPDVKARVVVNERTGTIVVGENVRLSPVAIAHSNLRIEIQSTPVISQPSPLSGGRAVVAQQTQTAAKDNGGRLLYVEDSANLKDVAAAMNAIGVSPRDVVAIFQALKQAGALKADLIIM